MFPKEGLYKPIFIIYRFSKILGFTLHDFSYFQAENVTNLKVVFKHIIRSLVASAMMLVPLIISANDRTQTESTSRKLLSVINGFRIVGCSAIIISDLHNQMHIILATRYLNNVDKVMFEMGTITSYKTHSILLFLGTISLLMSVLFARVINIVSGDSFWYIVMDLLTEGYPFLILSTNSLYLIFFLLVLRKRFISLMAITNRNRKNLSGDSEENQLKVFLKITQMYNDLCSCAASINQFTSLPSFLSLMCNLLEAMIVANLTYHKEGTYSDIFLVLSYSWLTLSTLLSPMFVEEMPGKLTRMLIEIDIPGEHYEMRKCINTFLYQALHNKVEFNICGLFPMSMSSLPEQFSFCISLVLFMYQIAG